MESAVIVISGGMSGMKKGSDAVSPAAIIENPIIAKKEKIKKYANFMVHRSANYKRTFLKKQHSCGLLGSCSISIFVVMKP